MIHIERKNIVRVLTLLRSTDELDTWRDEFETIVPVVRIVRHHCYKTVAGRFLKMIAGERIGSRSSKNKTICSRCRTDERAN